MNDRPAPSAFYDWSMTLASLWCSGGILLDAWYHFHNDIETFFEPAHALLYAGLFASYAFTAIAAWRFHRQGYPWRRALPRGYEITVAGLVVFLVGGILDMIKHTLWGFEEGFNALLSPTHLMIGAGIFLMVGGVVRSAIVRDRPASTLSAQLPYLLGLASMMELIHWGTQFIFQSEAEQINAPLNAALYPHDTFTLLSLQYDKQGLGLLAVIVQSLLIAGFAVYAGRRLALRPGAITVLLVAGNLFIALSQSNAIGQFLAVMLASVAAGIAGDLVAAQPTSPESRWGISAFLMPAVYWSVMLIVLALTRHGIWWSPDVISGSIVIAGVAGLVVSALSAGSSRPQEKSPSP